MSVPVGKRKENKLDVFLRAQDLAKYTIEILGNKKNFPARHQSVIDRLESEAWGIAEDVWRANNTYVGKGCDERSVRDRLYLQSRAVTRCTTLLFEIEMAQRVFHMPSKRAAYWSGMVLDVMNLAKAWHDSDRARLGTRL